MSVAADGSTCGCCIWTNRELSCRLFPSGICLLPNEGWPHTHTFLPNLIHKSVCKVVLKNLHTMRGSNVQAETPYPTKISPGHSKGTEKIRKKLKRSILIVLHITSLFNIQFKTRTRRFCTFNNNSFPEPLGKHYNLDQS